MLITHGAVYTVHAQFLVQHLLFNVTDTLVSCKIMYTLTLTFEFKKKFL